MKKKNNESRCYSMIHEFESHTPVLDTQTFVAEGAQLIGKVVMKEYSSIWFNSVVRGDVNDIEIGRYSNIQDNGVVHGTDDNASIIGDFVTVGHGCIIHGAIIEEHCLLGMNSVILEGSVIGKGSIIAAGSVILKNTNIPPHSLVIGVPGKVIKEIPESWDQIHAQALKYKTLWTERYGLLPNADGERYKGEKII
ncbi:MAG: gamma carbonic anhydrase family protein [Clostridiaceae bacterium]|nr:gamma carbonic anhydrase family protein [Clostridiaceae bacterium]